MKSMLPETLNLSVIPLHAADNSMTCRKTHLYMPLALAFKKNITDARCENFTKKIACNLYQKNKLGPHAFT